MRLSDFSSWQVLRVTCTRCKHAVLLDPKTLYRAANSPASMSLKDIEAKPTFSLVRLTCQQNVPKVVTSNHLKLWTKD
ncbi:hypothetical protein C7476_1425 [Phyllobacterium bourgognense]|uniref:Uncharacterized protein n=1 Tax=Phyllobacterium bourgognense TaxID=314236 RepID=A0A368YHG1_9HYPH|nr:hypothetical protein C7476_1425 [Phyllobacterium bourgognense]